MYAKLFVEKVKEHNANCWLVNTGWVGEPYGKGKRIPIAYSRAIVRSIIKGTLDRGEFRKDPEFGIMVPKTCEGVPAEVLDPLNGASDKGGYMERAKALALSFKKNFKQFEGDVTGEVLHSMP